MKLTLSLILFIALAFTCNAQYYTYKNFTHQDGLLIASTTSLVQAADGGIIIGTQGEGMIEYDGYSFNQLFTDESEIQYHVGKIEYTNNQLLFPDPYKGIYKVDQKGKVNLFFQQDGINGYNEIFELNGEYFVGHNKGIFKIKANKAVPIYSTGKDSRLFEISQRISVPDGLVLLTNCGNFHLSSDGFQFKKLNSYLNTDNKLLKSANFGYFSTNELVLFDEQFHTKFSCNWDNKKACKSTTLNGDFPTKTVTSGIFNPFKNCFTICQQDGHLFEINTTTINEIPFNFDGKIAFITQLIVDKNGDYWMSSNGNGLLKVSIEPFTKLHFNEAVKLKEIMFTFSTLSGDMIISTAYNGTYIGKISSTQLANYSSITIRSATYHNSKLYCATNQGLKIFNENTKQFENTSPPPNLTTTKINFVFSDGIHLWVGGENQIAKWKIEKNKSDVYHKYASKAHDFSYTAQVSFDKKHVYIGGNNGIFKYTIGSTEVKRLPLDKLGYYAGISVKDVFGTNWFTLEKGIIGITIENKIIQISDKRYFPSKLFYTLNSDQLGNLIIGTNKGLNILKINEEGKVLDQSTYDHTCGFDGYETNMRSSSQNGNELIIGTINGLYVVNPSLFQYLNPPSAPQIKITSNQLEHQNGTLRFTSTSKNPKTKLIYFRYRIPEISEDWKPISSQTDFQELNLSTGEYTLEVKASYNGYIFSEISSIKVQIHRPIYHSSWFVITAIIALIIINILILLRVNTSHKKSIILTSEYFTLTNVAPNLILFGAIANTFSALISNSISDTIQTNIPIALSVGFLLIALYFISIANKLNNNIQLLRFNLTFAFFLLLAYNIFALYTNSLHPYFVFAIILIASVSPYIFSDVTKSTIFAICFSGVCIFISYSTTTTLYEPQLFNITIIVSTFLNVVLTYLRNDSIHKLAFVSAIVNNGTIPTIAVNKNGTISYVSKNISKFIAIEENQLMNQQVSILNQFVSKVALDHHQKTPINFLTGTSKILPMYNPSNEITWMEWSYNEFSEDIRVLFGQDVTERIKVQNTYEQLVQNAEDYIYQVDMNGLFQFVNARFHDRLNYEENELIGTFSVNFVVEEFRDKVTQFYEEHFQHKKRYSYMEFPILKKDGTHVWLGQYVTTLFKPGSDKIINGFIALGRDITQKREDEQLIHSQNQSIKSSINYAKRIQQNLLASEETLNIYFKESFVFFKPKDIVSGDFYWTRQIGDYTVIVVGDSTGHGVPGAFMSLLGLNLLNSIIHEHQLLNPGKTLDEIDVNLRKSLPRHIDGNTINDGMELAICVLNNTNSTMLYACAGSKFLVHNGTSFNLYKGDSKHIGDERIEGFNGYVTHHTTLEQNSTLYLFTDGFQDQFGGRKEKKYSMRRLLELLEENIRLPLAIQSQMIEKEFENWKGDEQQTDDVTIIAVRKKESS